MATITVEGVGNFEADSTTRMVNAIEGHGMDILHRCGGNARCTTCRVEFISGEPRQMTRAEYERLVEREVFGQVRLSCQILCDHDMHVRVVNRLSATELSDAGPEPAAEITPPAEWMERPS